MKHKQKNVWKSSTWFAAVFETQTPVLFICLVVGFFLAKILILWNAFNSESRSPDDFSNKGEWINTPLIYITREQTTTPEKERHAFSDHLCEGTSNLLVVKQKSFCYLCRITQFLGLELLWIQSFKHHLVISAMKLPSLLCITLIYYRFTSFCKKKRDFIIFSFNIFWCWLF